MIRRIKNLRSSLRGMYQRAYEAFLIIPVVYKCVRWDSSSLLIILEHWMGRMQDCHEQDKWHTHNSIQRNVKSLKMCRFLLKRLIADEYSDSFHKEHDARWGEAEYWFTPTDETKSFFTWNNSRPKAVYAHEKAQERKEYKQWILEHPEYLKNQDMDYLFKLIKKHIDNWWN